MDYHLECLTCHIHLLNPSISQQDKFQKNHTNKQHLISKYMDEVVQRA